VVAAALTEALPLFLEPAALLAAAAILVLAK